MIVEILLHLVGATGFAILLLDEQRGVLRPLAALGIEVDRVGRIRAGEGMIGRVIGTGRLEQSPGVHDVDLAHPAMVAPLRLKDRVVGAIAVWQLLPQRPASGISTTSCSTSSPLTPPPLSRGPGSRPSTPGRRAPCGALWTCSLRRAERATNPTSAWQTWPTADSPR